jgi:hypothetical protein
VNAFVLIERHYIYTFFNYRSSMTVQRSAVKKEKPRLGHPPSAFNTAGDVAH